MSGAALDYDSLMQANLARVFNERDAARRFKAAAELYADDALLYETDLRRRGGPPSATRWRPSGRTCRRTSASGRRAPPSAITGSDGCAGKPDPPVIWLVLKR
jgi:hypothetical protein